MSMRRTREYLERNDSLAEGPAFPVQYEATKGGPPVRYRNENCEDWSGLAVLYCRYSPSLKDVLNK